MKPPRPSLLAPLFLSLALGACASGDTSRFPSLAMRDVERISGTAMPVANESAPQTPVAPSADLSARLADLTDKARRAHDAFLKQLPGTRQAVSAAGGSEVASEGWSVAQAALSGLEASRNPAVIALADLDSLYVKSELEVGAADAVAAARDAVGTLVREQDTTIDGLATQLAE